MIRQLPEWQISGRTGLKNPLLAISSRHASSLAERTAPLILLTLYHFSMCFKGPGFFDETSTQSSTDRKCPVRLQRFHVKK
jgi:hypothetical protein